MEKEKNNIHERIDILRKLKGWTRSHLADEIGISKNSVYAWYGEKAFMPSLENILAICDACNITLTEFFSDIDTNKLKVQEILLIEAFRNVPMVQKNQVIEIVKSFIKNN